MPAICFRHVEHTRCFCHTLHIASGCSAVHSLKVLRSDAMELAFPVKETLALKGGSLTLGRLLQVLSTGVAIEDSLPCFTSWRCGNICGGRNRGAAIHVQQVRIYRAGPQGHVRACTGCVRSHLDHSKPLVGFLIQTTLIEATAPLSKQLSDCRWNRLPTHRAQVRKYISHVTALQGTSLCQRTDGAVTVRRGTTELQEHEGQRVGPDAEGFAELGAQLLECLDQALHVTVLHVYVEVCFVRLTQHRCHGCLRHYETRLLQ
eukprot:4380430-Amphidinium_carterae.1